MNSYTPLVISGNDKNKLRNIRNWEWCCSVSFLGIYFFNFRYSVLAVYLWLEEKFLEWVFKIINSMTLDRELPDKMFDGAVCWHLVLFQLKKDYVRPDWINMRVVRPWKRHQPLQVFDFFKFHSWKFEKTSKFWVASCKNESNLLLVRITVCIESYRLEHFYLMKNLPKFGLRDVGILYSRVVIQRTIDVSPAFLKHSSAGKNMVWAHASHDPNKHEVGFIFPWNGSELWTLIKYSRSKINKKNKKKPMVVDVLFKAYPMIPLSWRSNLARRYL
jgi:hypothetical protein